MRRRPDCSFACETNAYFRRRNKEKKKRAIFKSANFSSIATDDKGVIQIFNVGAERMLGFTTEDVINKITPADISDPQEVITHAKALSAELGTVITPGFEALVFKASRGIEDIYEITYIYAFPTSGLDYLTKPFQIEELHACVETHLKIRRQQRDLEVCSHDLEVVHTRMQLDLDLSHQVGATGFEPAIAETAHCDSQELTSAAYRARNQSRTPFWAVPSHRQSGKKNAHRFSVGVIAVARAERPVVQLAEGFIFVFPFFPSRKVFSHAEAESDSSQP